jgi:hypothetical protein
MALGTGPGNRLGRSWPGHDRLHSDEGTGTCWAMAHITATSARAIAPTPCGGVFPRALSCRYRVHRRTCAFPCVSWIGLGSASRRSCRCRRTWAGSRDAQAAFDQGAARRGRPRLGEASLAAARAPGIFRRRQAPILPELSGMIEAGQVAECRDGGDRPRQLHATEALERLDHRAEPPGDDRRLECLRKPLEPCGVVGDRPDRVLADAWLGGGGTDDCAEPAPVRRAPGGPTGIPDLRPQQKGVQAQRGRLESVERLCARGSGHAWRRLRRLGHRPA